MQLNTEKIAEYQDLIKSTMPTKPEKVIKTPKIQVKEARSFISPEKKRLIVSVYFGSTTTFDKPAITLAEVGRIFRIPPQTVYKFVKEFRTGSFDYNVFQRRQRPRCKMVNAELQERLLSEE